MISKFSSSDHFAKAFEKVGFNSEVLLVDFEKVFVPIDPNKRKRLSFNKNISSKARARAFFDFYNACFQETQIEKTCMITHNSYLSTRHPINETIQVASKILEMILIYIAQEKKYRFLTDSKISSVSIVVKTNRDSNDFDDLDSSVFTYYYLFLFVVDGLYIQEIDKKILISTLRKILANMKKTLTKKDFKYMPFYKEGYPINIYFDVSCDKNKYDKQKEAGENKSIC